MQGLKCGNTESFVGEEIRNSLSKHVPTTFVNWYREVSMYIRVQYT